MATIREVLAKNLKENRQKLGITQAELAEKAGISTNFVAMIELKKKFPAPEMLERIAAALNVEASTLFATSTSPELALERLHTAVVADIKRVIGEAVKEVIAETCGKNSKHQNFLRK